MTLVGDDVRTDTVLLKFLRAFEFKVKEAMVMLRKRCCGPKIRHILGFTK